MNKKLILLATALLMPLAVIAQSITVKGVVLEQGTEEPIAGASVVVKGSTRGVMADIDGRFELPKVKPTDILEISFIGMVTQEVKVGDNTDFKIYLKTQASELDEAVVVAFGTQKKESVIGAITTVKTDVLKVPASDLTTSLAGNVAGLIAYTSSGEPGQDNTDFFVRGITTFGANTSPLILIDNIELTATDLSR
ncbi:MAG: carboxypeptidase-like regulatory domain-containing protein, partial [Bacteroidales bacterium]|nr:carboxypeptidase-like regulatory domain-containing protein [Bacteroidales bacterium]